MYTVLYTIVTLLYLLLFKVGKNESRGSVVWEIRCQWKVKLVIPTKTAANSTIGSAYQADVWSSYRFPQIFAVSSSLCVFCTLFRTTLET